MLPLAFFIFVVMLFLKKLLCSVCITLLWCTTKAQDSTQSFDCGIAVEGHLIQWVKLQYPQSLRLDKGKKGEKLPLRYAVFIIEKEKLAQYLNFIEEKESHIVMPLPTNDGCVKFVTRKSNVMSEALKAKFPNIVSLKGIDITNPLNHLRLDFDGEELKAEIFYQNETYIITPFKRSKRLYYIVYNKKDTRVEKQNFESAKD